MEMGYLELTKRLLAAEARVAVAQAADRQAVRARVAARQPGGRPARRSAVLHRRQPALHGDGDARQGAAHQGALRRPRSDRRRLPPADDVARRARREPPGRGVGAVARPEDPRPRARSAGGDALAAQPAARVPPGQAADARRPARVGLPHRRHRDHARRRHARRTIGELFEARRARRRGAHARRAPAARARA